MRSEQEIQEVLKRIRQIVDSENQRLSYNILVPEDGFVQEDDWINVLVAPDQLGVSASDFADVLMRIDAKLRDEGIEQVLVVPAKPNAA